MLIALTCLVVASCSCSDEDIDGDGLVDGCEHYWDNGEIIEEATVTKMGKISYTCLLCGGVREEVIPKKAHTHTYSEEWKSDRMNHWLACGVEGCTVKGSKDAHQWDGGEILVESNPVTTGKKKFTCTVCSYEKEESYRALATVTEAEYLAAVTGEAFENVTIQSYFEGEHVFEIKIADGLVQVGDVTAENNSENPCGSYKMAQIFNGIDYEALSYDEETRAYFCDTPTARYTLQFADGKVYSVVMMKAQGGEAVTEKLIFTTYGRTVIEK